MDHIESIIVLAIVVGLVIVFLKGAINNRLPSQDEFQRMADEYSTQKFYRDIDGTYRIDADYLIDVYLRTDRRKRVAKALEEFEPVTQR